MKITCTETRDGLCDDAISDLDIAADLLHTVIGEHFERCEMPEEFGDSYSYQTIQRKLAAISSLMANALEIVHIARDSYAGDYFGAKCILMSEILTGKTRDL